MKNIASSIIDSFLMICIGLFAVYLLFPYIHAEHLNTEYPDWYVHAFRIRLLQEHGFSSWSHIWSNGISLWTAYQFAIHYLTFGIATITSASVPRAMVLIVLILTVMYGIFQYVSMRLLPVSRRAALTATLLAFTISQYYVAIRDYSILLGFAVYPLIIILWKKYLDGKCTFLFPYICGLLFYIHPIVALFSFGLYIISFFSHNRKLLSPQTPIQILFFTGASALFWYPVAFHPGYANPILSGPAFLNLVLLPRELYGISWIVYGLFVICVLCFLVPGFSRPRWWSMLTIYTAIWILLVYAGLSDNVPRILSQFQFTRGMVFIGINIVFLCAYLFDRMIKSSSLTVQASMAALATIAMVRAVWFATLYAPPVRTELPDQLAPFVETLPELKGARVWPFDIGSSSFTSGGTVLFPVSYAAHRDANPLSQRLIQLGMYDPHMKTGTPKNLERFDAYLRVSATPYVLFDSYAPVGNGLEELYGYEKIGTQTIDNVEFFVRRAPWISTGATLIDQSLTGQFEPFPPEAHIESIQGQTLTDDHVIRLSNVLSDEKNRQVAIQYPTEETMYVFIPEDTTQTNLFIAETYDENWRAFVDNKQLTLNPAGPNYMMVDLEKNTGKATVVLIHSWPLWFHIVRYVVVASGVSLIIFSLIMSYIRYGRH